MILMSGVGTAPWAYIETNPLAKALQLAQNAGIKNPNNTTQLANELRNVDAGVLIEAYEKMKVI